ncbi:MAG TPA: EsaB/YukD family protein [Nocardioides sp.]|uniref:EsaB/YukD family protein n=1 Tax=Nocardioides sp. TaxID=35761 RepID=UPI002EDB4480
MTAPVGVELGLLRVSVVAGGRRVDVTVPPLLPVAELVPQAALALGLPEEQYAGLRLAPLAGAPLADDRGLAPQGVPDAAVLVLTDETPTAPVVHDDPAVAVAAAAREVAGPGPVSLRALAAAWVTGTGLAGVVIPVLQRLDSWLCAVALVVSVLGGAALPRVALRFLEPAPADGAPVVDRARQAHRAIVAGTLGLGATAALCVPVVAGSGTPGALLGLAAGVLLLVRCRRHAAPREVVAGALAGGLVLASLAVSLLWSHPGVRLPGGLLLLTAAGLALLPPPRPSPVLGVLGDVVEQAAVVALLPLLVLSSGLVNGLVDGMVR